MNIIKSDLVSPEYDVFWEDVTALTNNAAPRPVLVLINRYEAGSHEQTQLHKMLDACKLLPEQYNIIFIEKDQKAAWHKLKAQLDPKIIFLIGVTPGQLGISSLFRLNEPNRFDEKVWLPTIPVLEQDNHPDVKKQLWVNGMKPVFVDKMYGTF